MKKVRRAHLWIGLIASVFIFMEALTGLLMTEPWLIGQSGNGVAGGQGMRGDFQRGQFPQGQSPANNTQSEANNGQVQNGSNNSGQYQAQDGSSNNSQFQGQAGFGANGQFRGQSGFNSNGNFLRNRDNQGIMGIIRGLHEGRIGTTNIKWLIDLIAIAMMVLTATGIYMSINVLRAENKRKKQKLEMNTQK